MAWIYNSELSKELKEGAKLQQARDLVPNQLADKVVPVMEVNPKLLRRAEIASGAGRITSGTATYYTTNANKDFYLTGLTFSIIKDATCDVATGRIFITGTINGLSSPLASIAVLTTTAQNATISKNFDIPVKIDRNTSIQSGQTWTAGAMSLCCDVQGYYSDNTNA